MASAVAFAAVGAGRQQILLAAGIALASLTLLATYLVRRRFRLPLTVPATASEVDPPAPERR